MPKTPKDPTSSVRRVADRLLPEATPHQKQRVVCRCCVRFGPADYQRCEQEKQCGGSKLFKPRANSALEAISRAQDAALETASLWGLEIRLPDDGSK